MSYWEEKHSEETNHFEQTCIDVAHRITSKAAIHILCCVDGSDKSDLAFRSSLNLRRKFDHIVVFHAYRDDPNLQPPSWRHNQLYTTYETLLIGCIPKQFYSIVFNNRMGDSVNGVLHKLVDSEYFCQFADNHSELSTPPDLIVLGNHGRKGAKAHEASIGTTANQALGALQYPCLIVKNLVPAGPRSFLMAVNESSASKRGLDILLRFVNPRDTLVLVHFTHPFQTDPALQRSNATLQAYYEKELMEAGPPDSKFVLAEYKSSVALADAIANYANDSTADIFAIAPRATTDRSSITDSVVGSVMLTVLLCKN